MSTARTWTRESNLCHTCTRLVIILIVIIIKLLYSYTKDFGLDAVRLKDVPRFPAERRFLYFLYIALPSELSISDTMKPFGIFSLVLNGSMKKLIYSAGAPSARPRTLSLTVFVEYGCVISTLSSRHVHVLLSEILIFIL